MTWGEWSDLLLRWAHLIAGIAWIGSSFYFIWLDRNLNAPARPRERVTGELWMVHSGGFYQVERRRVGPGEVPATLHWFKWEAAITWLTGFFLLGVVYYSTRGLYLVDRSVADLPTGAAIGIGLAVVLLAWPLYDGLWRSPLGRSALAGTAIALALLAGISFLLCSLLSGRAAFLHVGAALGTLMTANVWMRILPAQRQMVAATERGEEPDFTLGEHAKRRSLHNSYMTFPVLFLMLSVHFPATWGHPLNWLVLGLFFVLGAGARHLMIGEGAGRWWAAAPAGAALAGLIALTAPPAGAPSRAAGAVGADTVEFARVQAVIVSRCVTCHSERPALDAFGAAPGGVSFDTTEEIVRQAERIRQRVAVTRTMPLGNLTRMTLEERALLRRWADGGAPGP